MIKYQSFLHSTKTAYGFKWISSNTTTLFFLLFLCIFLSQFRQKPAKLIISLASEWWEEFESETSQYLHVPRRVVWRCPVSGCQYSTVQYSTVQRWHQYRQHTGWTQVHTRPGLGCCCWPPLEDCCLLPSRAPPAPCHATKHYLSFSWHGASAAFTPPQPLTTFA